MPRFQHMGELASASISARLVACDGVDGRPCEEGVEGNSAWFTLRGRFALDQRSGRHVSDPARALLLRPEEPFCIHHPEGCGDVCLAVGGRVVDQAIEGPATRPTTDDAFLGLRALARALADGRAVEPLEAEEAVAVALDPAPAPPARATPREVRLAREVEHRLALGFDERLTLSALAAPHGVSVFALCRAFRAVHATGIHRRLQVLRLRHALALMLDSDRTLADIAVECGFASHAHMTTLFRRQTGLTPRAARRLAAGPRPRGRRTGPAARR
jgi:AraC-like DNA-binding protein